MTALFNGLVHLTSEPDVGKTSMALECGADPTKIMFVDSDIKSRSAASGRRHQVGQLCPLGSRN
jgi:hypothetical protein